MRLGNTPHQELSTDAGGLGRLRTVLKGRQPHQLRNGELRAALQVAGIATTPATPRETQEIQLQTLINLTRHNSSPTQGQLQQRNENYPQTNNNVFTPQVARIQPLQRNQLAMSESEDNNIVSDLDEVVDVDPNVEGAYAVEEFDEGLYFQLNMPVSF